jgi:hypothetical protein
VQCQKPSKSWYNCESQQNEWIKVMRRNNMKSQGQDISLPSNEVVLAAKDQKARAINPPGHIPWNRKEQ